MGFLETDMNSLYDDEYMLMSVSSSLVPEDAAHKIVVLWNIKMMYLQLIAVYKLRKVGLLGSNKHWYI